MATKKAPPRGSSRGKSAATRKKNAAAVRARHQMHAIVLLAIGVLVGALSLIEGASVWQWLHNILYGLFGAGAVLVALLLLYTAVLMTMDKPARGRTILGAFLVTFICAAWQIFKMGLPVSENVLEILIECVEFGIQSQSGGLIGAIIGVPLLTYCGKIGAGIIIVLLIFVFLMLFTGGTLIGLAHAAHKPVKQIGETYAQQMSRQEQRRAQRAAAPPPSRIDIPLETPFIPHRGKKAAAEAAVASAPAAPAEPADSAAPAAQLPRFAIDIPIEGDFDRTETGGFSLMVGHGDPMQYVAPAQPSLDELVNKAATDTGRFRFEPGRAAVKAEPETTPEATPMSDATAAPEAAAVPPEAIPETIDAVVAAAALKAAAKAAVQTEPEPQKPDFPEEPAPIPPIYRKPPVSLLHEAKRKSGADESGEMKANAQRLVDTLASFGVQTRIVDISRGPSVTRYELQPSAGVKISRITGLADDIALNLAAAGVRIEAPIPNKAAVGIEIPNKVVGTVCIREIIASDEFKNAKTRLCAALGRDITGNVAIADISKMPHLLIAGSTGSGKSVCINSIIISLLYQSTPAEVRFLMIDPKVVELGVYNGIPQLLVPVVTDPKKAAGALSWAVTEMLKRYQLFAEHSVRDLAGYNTLADKTEGLERMPQIVIIIDELADLMMAAPSEIEDYICRLAQMARAAGMHLIIATQRPSVDVITGIIKANIPSRIAFAVSSQVDSRTILDMGGAEKLLGRGDMLFNPVGAGKPLRVQGCFVTDDEIEAVISFIKNDSTAEYDENIVQEIDSHVVSGKTTRSSNESSSDSGDVDDEMLMPAIECVVEAGMASTSLLQRRLKLGYARAARIVDELETRGIVGPFEGSKPRQVLISKERWIEMKLASAD